MVVRAQNMFNMFQRKPEANTLIAEARSLIGRGNMAKALAIYDRLVKTYPDLPDSFADRGTALAIAGKLQEAIVDLKKAIQLGYNHSSVYTTLATAQMQSGDLTSAVANFGAAVALEPENALIYYNRASLLSAMKDIAGARSDLERCLQLGPDAKFKAAIQRKLENLANEP